MTKVSRRTVILVAASAAGAAIVPFGLAAAQDSTPVGGSLLDSLGLPELEITITDDGVQAPDSFEAGPVLLVVNNATASLVSFMLAEPPDGTTPEMVLESFARPVIDAWWAEANIPVVYDAMPGQTVKIAVLLPAGEYQVAATAGSPDEMSESTPIGIAPMSVTGDLAADAADAIESAATIEFGAYEFTIDGAIPAGPAIVKVTNTHVVLHHAIIFATDKLYSHDEAHAGVMSMMQGTPSAEGAFSLGDAPPVLATPVIGGGATIWIDVDFQPGFYAAICFVADPGQEVPHVMMGMIQVFEVAG